MRFDVILRERVPACDTVIPWSMIGRNVLEEPDMAIIGLLF